MIPDNELELAKEAVRRASVPKSFSTTKSDAATPTPMLFSRNLRGGPPNGWHRRRRH
jgi:hypothetical protein